METKSISTFGSILKKEPIIPVEAPVLPHTTVAEANRPYYNYWGKWPSQSTPNSLFLFTKRYYTLYEVLRFSQGIEFCKNAKINVASAMVDFYNELHPAIRIKHFPEYQRLVNLQECLINEGVEFAGRMHFPSEVSMRISKWFTIEEVGDGIYLDAVEDNKGYVVIPKRITGKEIDELGEKLKLSTDCGIFDVARCGMVFEGISVDLVRIFSGGLKPELLKCIREKIGRMV